MPIPGPNLKPALLLLFTLFCIGGYAQKLSESRQSSYFTYIYQITEKEAQQVYKKDLWEVDRSFFHTMVDSFPTDKGYDRRLPQGHYLQVYAEKNREKISITSIQDFEVFILNNNTDLKVQVMDLQGNIIPDAAVSVDWKGLGFDPRTQAYVDRKSNQKGLLKVQYQGFTAFYKLGRQYNNSAIIRGSRKVVYGTPLKYIWMPVNFTLHLPIDAYKSISDGWPQGTIYRTKNFLERAYEKTACLFDDYYCDNNPGWKFRQKHSGYLVFNKPRYMPGDTVRFKAYILNRKGKGIDEPVEVMLLTQLKPLKLTSLRPYKKGGYAGQFVLHDSLQLQLDRRYTLSLRFNKEKEYISGTFEYEDYELGKNQLNLRLEEETHYRDKPFKLFVKGTDEKELNLLDARLKLLIRPKKVHHYFMPQVFVPDTLLFLEKELAPTAETEIIIPDSLFPQINFDYEIQASLLTSDNELVAASRLVSFYHAREEFSLELLEDSLQFDFQKNGLSKNKEVKIIASDKFGNQTEIYRGMTPCLLELEPYFSSYRIQSDSLAQTFSLGAYPSLLQCFSERSADSVHIVVENPRKIPFSYHIYKKNQEQKAGYSDALNLKQKNRSKQTYFVSLSYLWGGEVKEEHYQVPLKENTLRLSLSQPMLVYPGQKSRIEVLVTDYQDKPVPGVDLTAYSLTSKFGYSAPELPYLGKLRKGKSVINNFHLRDSPSEQHPGLQLNYDAWKTLAGLDSIAYFQFAYPGGSIYRNTCSTGDSLTQFAPFVVSKGAADPIHVIYVDNRPVYFSWATHAQPYSFAIDSGYHQLRLRTTWHELTLDSLYFEHAKKLVLSVDRNEALSDVKVVSKTSTLSAAEQRLLSRYLFPYRNTFGESFAYLEQENGQIQWLNPSTRGRNYHNLAGPVAGSLSFHLLDSTTTHFLHEPYFEYEFSPGLLKMRQQASSQHLPKILPFYQREPALADSVISRIALSRLWKKHQEDKRYSTARYTYPRSSSPGAGRLILGYAGSKNIRQELPLNVLLFKKDEHDFLRVYPGNTTELHQLEKGWYKLIYFYAGARYHAADSIHIQANGLNYFELEPPTAFQKDTFSLFVSELIEKNLFKNGPFVQEEKERRQIYTSYQQQYRYTGVGDFIEGYVYDRDTDDPLPGVNVVIKGTNYGTVTDLDGHYSLTVPSNYQTLIFSFIGYLSEEVPIGYNSVVNVSLEPDIQQLEEVVVVGYGTETKTNFTGSISTVNAQSLSGYLPGLQADFSQELLQGRVAGVTISSGNGSPGQVSIQIRGMAPAQFDQKPLYIINGLVFTGDIAELDPKLIQKIGILKGEDATALYGAKAAHGAVIIETRPGSFTPTSVAKLTEEEAFFEAASQANSIRENFSDYAFWQPSLTTDQNGRASFEVTFPDDVTSWETYFLAMNEQKQSGQASGLVKSYKPLMAQLAVPIFLLQSDTSYAIGKVLNYFPEDSIKLTTRFELNNRVQSSREQYCTNFLIDSLPLIAQSDSLLLKYFLEKEDGYLDGEQKSIPVFPVGLEESKGGFLLMEKDSLFSLKFDPSLGPVKLYARADVLEVMEDEIRQLVNYKYYCNEQIASKLKGLLAAKSIATYKGQKFKEEGQVEKLIRLLKKNQKSSGLWGWWRNSEEQDWISLHVLEALVWAEQAGFKTSLDKGQIIDKLVWELEKNEEFYLQIRMLKILHLLDGQVDYPGYLKKLEKSRKLSFNSLLHLMEIKELRGIKYKADTLEIFKTETLLGNIYYSEERQGTTVMDKDIENTLLAYRILKADTLANAETLGKIRNYFLEKKSTAYWTNTYESAQIIETILPDLLGEKKALQKPSLSIRGNGLDKTISEFPFEMEISPQSNIQLSKEGDLPVYFTWYQQYWNSIPEEKKGDFEITTYFEGDSASYLIAGQKISLVARVMVKKDADYVMINVPVPAGCSYADKRNSSRHETHREYYRNETTIFCEKLAAGNYTFRIELIPRYSGTYTLNPAKVELMYFPTFNANNSLKSVGIRR